MPQEHSALLGPYGVSRLGDDDMMLIGEKNGQPINRSNNQLFRSADSLIETTSVVQITKTARDIFDTEYNRAFIVSNPKNPDEALAVFAAQSIRDKTKDIDLEPSYNISGIFALKNNNEVGFKKFENPIHISHKPTREEFAQLSAALNEVYNSKPNAELEQEQLFKNLLETQQASERKPDGIEIPSGIPQQTGQRKR